MSRFNGKNYYSGKNMCRTCLQVGDHVRIMTTEEINTYFDITNKPRNEEVKIYICIFCAKLLNKFTGFIKQCVKANQVFESYIEQATNNLLVPQLLMCHNLGFTDIVIHDICHHAEEMKDDHGDDFNIDDAYTVEDEVSLNFVNKTADLLYNIANAENDKNIEDNIKTKENNIKKNKDTRVKVKKKDSNKVLKKGFTSKMVQETDEYVVIKLSTEEVKQEMLEYSKSDKYQRAVYKCVDCVKGFNFEEVLKTHMERHSTEFGSYLCDICKQYCPSKVSFNGHMKSHTTRYRCKVCGDTRKSRQHLLDHHTQAHKSDARHYSCGECDFVTNIRQTIQRHVKIFHKERNNHPCEKCGKLFKTIESLRVHNIRHDKSALFRCPQCDKTFVHRSLLNRHIQSYHENNDSYCVECDISFKSEEYLKSHFKRSKRHRDPSKFGFKCDQCVESFYSRSMLNSHKSAKHGVPKHFKCIQCEQSYCTKGALAHHSKRHMQEPLCQKLVNCDLCEKSFKYQKALSAHMRVHAAERPFECECGQAYRQASALKVHIAAKHKKPEESPKPEF